MPEQRGVCRGATLPERFKTYATPVIAPALMSTQEPPVVFDPQ
ncbi:MAG TPA: hypothetical protein VH590_09255 [Ktedonobacterales bacterium]